MKLQVDFSGLWSAVHQMGPEIQVDDFTAVIQIDGFDELDENLSNSKGTDVDFDQVTSENGVLSYQGRQILLFIPDQGNSIDFALQDPMKGRRYHVAECKTLTEMRNKRRFDRYRATNNLQGQFHVYGESKLTGRHLEGDVALKVCMNCLEYLNYQGFKTDASRKKQIHAGFDIGHFLSHYSTLFLSMPPTSHFVEKGGYADDWAEVSALYRQSKNYKCESCSLDLSKHKQLLHTHHINGNKRQNNAQNLMALCIDCHRKQPNHEYMRVKPSDMHEINSLRREQGLLGNRTWADALKMADTSIHGVLLTYQSEGRTPPQIGFEVLDKSHDVICQLEAAWPEKRFGLVISDDNRSALNQVGWVVQTVGEAIRSLN